MNHRIATHHLQKTYTLAGTQLVTAGCHASDIYILTLDNPLPIETENESFTFKVDLTTKQYVCYPIYITLNRHTVYRLIFPLFSLHLNEKL